MTGRGCLLLRLPGNKENPVSPFPKMVGAFCYLNDNTHITPAYSLIRSDSGSRGKGRMEEVIKLPKQVINIA